MEAVCRQHQLKLLFTAANFTLSFSKMMETMLNNEFFYQGIKALEIFKEYTQEIHIFMMAVLI